jgi:integrase
MRTHNAQNERVKRRYFAYLREAKRYSEISVDMVAKALHRFEWYTRMRDFKAFHIEQAIAFKRHLSEQVSVQTGERLSKATLLSTLNALKSFFYWLAGQPGFRSRLSYADAEYFNLSEKETRIAKAQLEPRVPTLEQILHVIRSMPADSEVERRNRALVALTLLTGARDRAIASLKLKHVNKAEGYVVQDAREVHTKFAKTFTTWFFPVGDEVRAIVEHWIDHLLIHKLWSPDDPLFPATRVVLGRQRQFEAAGLDRRHWSDAGPIRRIFKAFEGAGLPYFNPHSLRKTLALLGQRLCRTPEEFKAWSQNLGHEQVLTTFTSYGEVATSRQAAIIRGLPHPDPGDAQLVDLAEKIMQVARRGSADRQSVV